MLGKMIKHELQETGKILIPLNLIVLGIMLLNAVFLGLDLFQKGYLKMIPTFSLMLYVLGLFALFVLTAVYLTMRFYKTMYSNQGYLTHTLPLSTTAILNTKILTAVLWLVIAFAATIGKNCHGKQLGSEYVPSFEGIYFPGFRHWLRNIFEHPDRNDHLLHFQHDADGFRKSFRRTAVPSK